MTQTMVLVGVPGAGKTETAIRIASKIQDRGFSIWQLGFSSFTRAARRESAARASAAFGIPVEDLEKQGWFRTMHSCCAKQLGLEKGQIVNNDIRWLKDVLEGQTVSATTDIDAEEAWTNQWKGRSPAAVALGMWDVARNRMVSLGEVVIDHQYRLGQIAGAVSFAEVEHYILLYEKAKQRDGRMDFCDLILRFAGVKMGTNGPEFVRPEGEIPPVPVWIFDEAQDTSPLLDRAARRMASESVYIYLMGDTDQGIYSWAGADPEAFLRWPCDRKEYLSKSWRCAREIMELGRRLIIQNHPTDSQFRVLAIAPRCEGGKVERNYGANVTNVLRDPTVQTLFMARTNDQCKIFQEVLSASNIPWKSLKSAARWPAETSIKLSQAFLDLREGKEIDGDAWRRIVKKVPVDLLERGTKAFYAPAASKHEVRGCRLETIVSHGGMPALAEKIKTGQWVDLLEKEEKDVHEARRRWGDMVLDPAIVISTIHGAKGMTADRVVLSTETTKAIEENVRTHEGATEERRVWYVAATRARDHLVLMESCSRNYAGIYDAWAPS